MNEVIFNLFYFCEDGKHIKDVGISCHECEGTDAEKLEFLKNNIISDAQLCTHYPIHPFTLDEKGMLTIDRFIANARIGNSLQPFEIALEAVNAPQSPLHVFTAIVNGIPRVDATVPANEQFRRKHNPNAEVEGVKVMPDYLEQYSDGNSFKIKKLLIDDHVTPIHLLFNNKHYLSSFKLLVSFIDTMAFIELGNPPRSAVFVQWMDKYSELHKLGITSKDLYELRNSLLHMTNLNSHKVIRGEAKRISYSVAPKGTPTREHEGITFFNYSDLIDIIEDAMDRWLNTYTDNHKKIVSFIERYDTIVRDNY